jgi:hypothetical protein
VELKAGVRLANLTPQIVLALMVADQEYRKSGFNLVVTSISDSKHGIGSLHYSGQAADLRTRTVPVKHRQSLRDTIARMLGPEFDVVLESDHIHLEYDPQQDPS